jgi:hypothetical protein
MSSLRTQVITSGGSWRADGSGKHFWSSVASSGDGKVVLVGSWDAKVLLLSNNYGESGSWEIVDKAKFGGELHERSWEEVSVSEDGKTLAVAELTGRIFTSTDGGQQWREVQYKLGRRPKRWTNPGYTKVPGYKSISVSKDGKKIALGELEPWLSTDYGGAFPVSSSNQGGSRKPPSLWPRSVAG